MSETEVVESYPTNFEVWIEEFNDWQTRIGFDPSWLGDYRFDIKFDWDTAGSSIEFGDFHGMPKWERRMQVPQQNIRDAIVSMVSVQGDTEFASVEQQIFQNSNLEKLLNLQETSQISQMVDFIGNRIEFASQKLPVEDGAAEFTYTIPAGVRDATINIANSAGLNVFYTDGDTNAGTHTFKWNGLDKNGRQVPDGVYTLLISAKDAFDKLAEIDYTVFGTVTGAGVDNGETELFIGDNLGVGVDTVLSVKKPATKATE